MNVGFFMDLIPLYGILCGPRLLRPVTLRPRNEDLGNRLSQRHAGDIVHREVNAGPNPLVACLFANGADKISMLREEVRQHL